MNDSLLFAGRDQRKAGLPAEMVEELNAMGQSVGDPAFVEAKIDEALTVRWLSARTGRGAGEIQAMLPSVTANYFGSEMTPSQAYDRIVATEAAASQGMGLQVAEAPMVKAEGQAAAEEPAGERDEVKYQGWQTPRALGSGFQEFALNVPQGMFSAAAGALGERMPDLVDPLADEETYRLARGAFDAERARDEARRLSGFDPGLDETGKAAVAAYGVALAKINDANKARLDEWKKTEADGTLRSVATFWKELADATDERWGVDPAFAASGYGQFVKGVGSMPATSALMATGVVGLLGVGGATFAGVELARMDYEGEDYDPAGAVWTNLLNTGGQTLLEKVIKLDGVLEKALENTAKTGGRVRLPDYLRSVARTAAGEGFEEVAQGQWDDVVAVAAYDEQRGAIPFIDEGVAKRRFWEFMAGAGGGAIMGATFGGALAFDQNRAAKKAGEYLTNRMGGLLNEFDAKQARRAFTDEEIRKMKDGETLLRAVNGDAKALSAYNKGVAAAKFINLKGASYGGVTLGEVDGRPAIMKDDGSVLVVDVSSPEAAKAWEDRVAVVVKMAAIAEDERASREAAVSSLIDYITARHAERDQSGELTIERGKGASLVKQVGSLEEAERIYASYVASGALPAGLDVRTLTITGSSQTRWNEGAKRWETAIKVADGAQPTVVIEESVEDFVKRQLATEELTPDTINSWRAEVEGAADVLDERGAIEWVSKYAVAYATGKAQEGDVRLPSAFRVFLERFAKFVKEALELGKKLLDMERAGEIPPEFLRLLQESTGTVAEKERGAVNEVPMASDVDAEMLADAMKQDDFPKIEKTEAGGFLVTAPDGRVLGTSETVEDAQDRAMAWYIGQEQAGERAAAKEEGGETAGDELMRVVKRLGGLLAASKEGTLRGELKAIAENMSTADRLRMFRKDAMDLDQLREALVDEGFDFETPADMLDAMERSTRGEPQYPKGAGGQTFSLGRAVPADASNVVEMPDGAKLVGPTTFSIEDYRGLHKAPVAEEGSSLDNLANIYPDDIYSPNAARFYGHFGDARDNEAVRIIQSMKERPNAPLTIYRAVPKQSGEAKAKLKELTNILGYRAKFGFFPMGNKVVAALEEKYAGETNYDKKQGLVVEDLNDQVSELEAAIKGAGKLTINPGDWVTTTRAYAVDHGESALNGSYDILKKTVKAKEIFTNGDSIHEWGYSPEGSKTTFSITAFHGTPHKVDKFSMSKIGTGEGAQAYGWGLYFAEAKAVGEGYRNTLTQNKVADLVIEATKAARVDKLTLGRDEVTGKWVVRGADGKANVTDGLSGRLRTALEALNTGGNLYTVELLPDADEFLDWDAPLSAQSEKVKAALAKLGGRITEAVTTEPISKDDGEYWEYAGNTYGSKREALDDWTAARLVQQNQVAETPEAAAKAMAAAGIPGIRYLDGGSRGTGEGTRNFVIFDENLVKIIAENGKPVGGGAGATFSLKPVDEFIKGSVVVNADGTPKEVFHGSPDIRGILKEGFQPRMRGDVFFFTDQKAVAETYADDRRAFDYQAAEPHVVSVFLSLKNPLRVDAKGARWRDTEKYIEEARAAGHDGIEIRNTRDEYNDMGRGRMSTVYAVFSPQQIRSSAKSPYFSRVDRQSLGMPQTFSLTPAPVFYSRLVRTVEQSTQGKASGAQWKATIRNSKLGVNQDEFALVGVNDLEDGKTYTKAEVLDYLRANEVKVADVTLGEPGKQFTAFEVWRDEQMAATPEARARGVDFAEPTEEFWNQLPEKYRQGYERKAREMSASRDNTEFSTYTLPGAIEGSYREVLLTVPDTQGPLYTKENLTVNYEESASRDNGRFWIIDGPGQTFQIPKSRGASEQAIDYIIATKQPQTGWRDGHSQYDDIVNPIVRLRYNERVTADGKRMLFLEEVQGPQKAEFEKMPELFQKNWREIGFKWALRKAVDGGFDVLGWTTGEQQAERYDLSKQVSGVRVEMDSLGGYGVQIQRPGNRGFVGVASGLEASQLEEHIGKDLAKKAVADLASKPSAEYTGLDLKVGGEGLTKLYDVDFRNVVNGLAPVKKAGQKVGKAELEGLFQERKVVGSMTFEELENRLMDIRDKWSGRNQTAAGWQFWNVSVDRQAGQVMAAMGAGETFEDAMLADGSNALAEKLGVQIVETPRTTTVNALELTDGTRAAAMGGQATFSLAQTETPAFKAWFKDSKVVDAQGKPLVVYHGGDVFDAFRDNPEAGAHYAVEDMDAAQSYAAQYPADKAEIKPLFLSIQNPLVIDGPMPRSGDPMIDEAKQAGHDGIIAYDTDAGNRGRYRAFAFFNPTQAKAARVQEREWWGYPVRATGNRGTFDPANPDITMSMFSGDEAGGQMSPEMVELVKRGDELDEVLAKYGRLYTNEVGKAALVRMREEGYLEAIDAGQAALRQSRKAGGQLSRLALPADFRAGRIIPEVGQLLRARTLAAGMKATEDNEKVVAMYVAAKKAGMTTGDISDMDHALNNGHKDVADGYAKKFGILREVDAYRDVLEQQMAEALELGVPPGKFFNGELDEETSKKLRNAMSQAKSLPAGQAGRAMIAILEAAGMKRNVASYWPRKVMNRDALLMTLGLPGLRDEFDKLMDKAEAEAKGAGRALTEAEMDALVDMANANLQRKRFESGRKTPGALKARVIETITKEQMVHYYKGIDAAMKHNTAMREYLETLRMFGKSVVFEPSGAEFEVLPINVTSSVGAWVVDYALKGGISSEQRRELESIVVERFSYKATPSFYAGLRSFSYLQNLTQVTTFLTATIADTWTGFYASGGSPYRYGKNFVKAMQGLSKISAMDVGLDPSRISAEYEALEGLDPTFKEAGRGLFSNILTEQGRANWTPSQALQRLFGWFANKVGLRYFERVTREAHLNSAVDYLIDQAKAGTLPRKLQRNLVRYFGEDKAGQVLADLKAGKADDADVRFYAFNALADWKAVSLDQMPETYLANPRGRVFYMYKTWIAAQFAGIHHEAGQDIASGEPKRVISGVTTLVYLAALMMAVGLPVDAIVSWVQGRPFILSDSAVNRLLGAIGAGRYVASKITRGEFKDAAMEFFAPPMGGALGDVQDDAQALYYLGTDLDAMKLKTWRNLPGFGRVINGYLGFKSEANAEARETAGGWMALTDGEEPKKTAEELEEMKRARLAKQYSVK